MLFMYKYTHLFCKWIHNICHNTWIIILLNLYFLHKFLSFFGRLICHILAHEDDYLDRTGVIYSNTLTSAQLKSVWNNLALSKLISFLTQYIEEVTQRHKTSFSANMKIMVLKCSEKCSLPNKPNVVDSIQHHIMSIASEK